MVPVLLYNILGRSLFEQVIQFLFDLKIKNNGKYLTLKNKNKCISINMYVRGFNIKSLEHH